MSGTRPKSINPHSRKNKMIQMPSTNETAVKFFATGALAVTLVSLGYAGGKGQNQKPDDWLKEAPAILRLANSSATSLRFTGVRLIKFRRAGVEEVNEEIVTRDGRRSRVEFRNGPLNGQIIVENGKERKHFFPDRNEVRVSESRPEEGVLRIGRFWRERNNRALKFRTSPGGEVAGIETEKVEMLDKDGNPILSLSIDPKSGLVMKRVFFDRVGTVTGQFEFKSVRFNPKIAPDAFKIDRKGVNIVRPVDDVRRVAAAEKLPALMLSPKTGFVLEGARSSNLRGTAVMAQFYTAPSGRLSLFVTKDKLEPERFQRMGRGRTSAHVWTSDGVFFALVGDLLPAQLKALSSKMTSL